MPGTERPNERLDRLGCHQMPSELRALRHTSARFRTVQVHTALPGVPCEACALQDWQCWLCKRCYRIWGLSCLYKGLKIDLLDILMFTSHQEQQQFWFITILIIFFAEETWHLKESCSDLRITVCWVSSQSISMMDHFETLHEKCKVCSRRLNKLLVIPLPPPARTQDRCVITPAKLCASKSAPCVRQPSGRNFFLPLTGGSYPNISINRLQDETGVPNCHSNIQYSTGVGNCPILGILDITL